MVLFQFVPGLDVVIHFEYTTDSNDGEERVRILDGADHCFLPEEQLAGLLVGLLDLARGHEPRAVEVCHAAEREIVALMNLPRFIH